MGAEGFFFFFFQQKRQRNVAMAECVFCFHSLRQQKAIIQEHFRKTTFQYLRGSEQGGEEEEEREESRRRRGERRSSTDYITIYGYGSSEGTKITPGICASEWKET